MLELDRPVEKISLAQYFRRADTPRTYRGDAAAATRAFRGDESRRRLGRDVDIPWRLAAAPNAPVSDDPS